MNSKLVTHFIAGYPSVEESLDIARGLIKGGAFALEMQIPYSDPTADGPVIEAACKESLSKGFKVSMAFDMLRTLRKESDIPIYIMSYGGIVYAQGVEAFCKLSKDVGATGLIIPDLAPGSDEGLYKYGKENGLEVVPVVIPGIPDKRVEDIVNLGIRWIYVALRRGITGTYTTLDDENRAFLKNLKSKGVSVMAGFGIQAREQVSAVCEIADAAIVGSQVMRTVADSVKSNGILKQDIATFIDSLI